ncbi:MAG TPA: hypothetical protein VFE47_03310 [Tepidisphaeraceae bacterium]|jgi:hypothetical protein|nr:hypothetical protein [Tepidisphaeraceae bacterium]
MPNPPNNDITAAEHALPDRDAFDQSILRQIAVNRARTPTERFQALCDLLDAARAMAPSDPESRQRRLRVKAAREQEREQWRAEYRRLFAENRTDAESGI